MQKQNLRREWLRVLKKLMKKPLNCQARQIKRKPQFQSKAKEN